MDPQRLRPEVRKTITSIPRLPFGIRPLIPLAKFIFNAMAGSKIADDVQVDKVKEDGVDMLVYSSKTQSSDAAVVWMFGGGHLAGKPEHMAAIASSIVHRTGARVFVPRYRLAPKYPFPADLDDCWCCWSWVVSHADELGISLEKLAVGGNSAGGSLAASLAQRICDAGGPQPVAQILFYPMLDDRIAADRSLDEVDNFIWRNSANHVAWGAYLAPHQPGAAKLPEYASAARRKDLSKLAPAWIGFGDLDLFATEDAEYADRLKRAGIECEALCVSGVPHAFEAIVPNVDVSKSFVKSAMDFLAGRFDAA